MKQLYKFILLLALILVGNFNAFAQEVDASNEETNTSLKEQRMTISVYNNTLYYFTNFYDVESLFDIQLYALIF